MVARTATGLPLPMMLANLEEHSRYDNDNKNDDVSWKS